MELAVGLLLGCVAGQLAALLLAAAKVRAVPELLDLIWVLDENDLVFGEHRGRVKEPGHDG